MASEDELLSLIQNKWKILDKFSLSDIYHSEDYFKRLYPNNRNIKAKLRQSMQILRNKGYIGFIDNKGHYVRLK